MELYLIAQGVLEVCKCAFTNISETSNSNSEPPFILASVFVFFNNCNGWDLITFIAFVVTICTKCSFVLLVDRLENVFFIPDNCSLNTILIPKHYFFIASFSVVPLIRVTFLMRP